MDTGGATLNPLGGISRAFEGVEFGRWVTWAIAATCNGKISGVEWNGVSNHDGCDGGVAAVLMR